MYWSNNLYNLCKLKIKYWFGKENTDYTENDSESSSEIISVEECDFNGVKVKLKENKVVDTGVNNLNKEYATSRPAINYKACYMGDLNFPNYVEPTLTSELSYYTLDEQEEALLKICECGFAKQDAFFIVQSEKYLVFGVVNVLGGSLKRGAWSKVFSHEMARYARKRSKNIIELLERKCTQGSKESNLKVESILNPVSLLQASFNDLVEYNCKEVSSSSNGIFGVYYHEKNKLSVANFGYSGIYVNTSKGFKFNTPVKKSNDIETLESTNPSLQKREMCDLLTNTVEVDCYTFKLSEGDCAMVATEGVWENFEIRNFEESSYFKKTLFNNADRYPKINKPSMKERFIRHHHKDTHSIHFLDLFYLYVCNDKSSHWHKRRVLRRNSPDKDVGKEQFILLSIIF